MTTSIWVYSESPQVALELMGAAAALGESLGTTSLLVELDDADSSLGAVDGRLVLRADRKIAGSPELAAEALARGARKHSPSLVLIGATRHGRQVAPMLAVKLRRGCLSEVFNLHAEGASLAAERNAYAARAVAQVSAQLPCVATVKVGAYKPIGGDVMKAEVENVGPLSPRVTLLASKPKEVGQADLPNAKVIVSAGRGFRRKEDLELAQQLADAFGGTVGCSRPLSSDYGWLPEEQHIGLTGITVHPELYLALGISGQLQHIAGIKDSRIIAAINTDRGAPIFEAADYGVVGDLYLVIPALLKLARIPRN